MPRLSLIVIARNEELLIGRCLRSVGFADEIVVVDNGSTDKTVEIARSLGAKVIETQDWPGFGPQKNRALDAATGDWVLSLDADEWIEPPLAEEIKTVLAKSGAVGGYMIPRRSRFCGVVVRHCGWSPDYVLRLWKRGNARFPDVPVHEQIELSNAGYLKQPIEHDSISDFADAKDKAARYGAAGAAELVRKGKRSSYPKAYARALWAFLRTYILQRGFLDGVTGWRVAIYNTDTTFQKYSRAADALKKKD